jgi:hypothetical protein
MLAMVLSQHQLRERVQMISRIRLDQLTSHGETSVLGAVDVVLGGQNVHVLGLQEHRIIIQFVYVHVHTWCSYFVVKISTEQLLSGQNIHCAVTRA